MAAVLNFTNIMFVYSSEVTIVCAILLLRTRAEYKNQRDAAVAMISVSALAIGYMLMNIFSTGPNVSGDVCSTLFGSTSILTLTSAQVKVCIILSVLVVILFVFLS